MEPEFASIAERPDLWPAAPSLDAAIALYSTLVSNAPIGMAVLDTELRFRLINPALAALNGVPAEDHIGRSVREIVPDLADTAEPLLQQVLAAAAPLLGVELRGTTAAAPDVERVWRENFYPVFGPDGAVVGIAVLCVELTEQQPMLEALQATERSLSQALSSLRESEHRYSTLVEAVPAFLYMSAPDGSNEFVNQRFIDFTGLAQDQARGDGWLAAVHPDDRQLCRERWAQSVATGLPFEQDLRMRQAAGGYRWFRTRSLPLRDAAGRVARWCGVSVDIDEVRRAAEWGDTLLSQEHSARRAAERAAARLARLQSVTASLSGALTPEDVARAVIEHGLGPLGLNVGMVWLLSSDGTALDAIYGIGRPLAPPGSVKRMSIDEHAPAAEAVRSGRPIFIESPAAVAERYPEIAAVVPIEAYGSAVALPLTLGERTVGALSCAFPSARVFDNDERAFLMAIAGQCAQALDRARLYTAAQEAVEVRDRFLAIATHDLRSPLTALLGQAQLLERRANRSGLDEPFLQACRAIVVQARRMQRLLAGLLDLSRLQASQLTISYGEVDLSALLEVIASEIRPTLTKHTLVLSGIGGRLAIQGDELRLSQVFHNLIANAVKYSPEGGVVRVDVSPNEQGILVAVIDQGIGIPAAARARMFERFYRAPNAVELGVDGMGIGLSVVREIVFLHGGTVDVASVESAGSTFTVFLPRQPGQ